jgi:hypothetical protein
MSSSKCHLGALFDHLNRVPQVYLYYTKFSSRDSVFLKVFVREAKLYLHILTCDEGRGPYVNMTTPLHLKYLNQFTGSWTLSI